jgi:hypothetical protein
MRGPPKEAVRATPGAFASEALISDARPRRLHVRYESALRRLYLAAAAGGAKMTPDQIAEAQRLAREWKPR